MSEGKGSWRFLFTYKAKKGSFFLKPIHFRSKLILLMQDWAAWSPRQSWPFRKWNIQWTSMKEPLAMNMPVWMVKSLDFMDSRSAAKLSFGRIFCYDITLEPEFCDRYSFFWLFAISKRLSEICTCTTSTMSFLLLVGENNMGNKVPIQIPNLSDRRAWTTRSEPGC